MQDPDEHVEALKLRIAQIITGGLKPRLSTLGHKDEKSKKNRESHLSKQHPNSCAGRCNPANRRPTVEKPLQNHFPQASTPLLKVARHRRLPVRVGRLPRGSNWAPDPTSARRQREGVRDIVKRTWFLSTITANAKIYFYLIYSKLLLHDHSPSPNISLKLPSHRM